MGRLVALDAQSIIKCQVCSKIFIVPLTYDDKRLYINGRLNVEKVPYLSIDERILLQCRICCDCKIKQGGFLR